jgi:HEAT repeat protein
VPPDLDRLIASFASLEPPASSLGAPILADTKETNAVVAMGAAAVPALTTALAGDDPKVAMYAAYCLGQIADEAALPELRRTRARYAAHEPKGEHDFAVLAALNRAEQQLAEQEPRL